MQGSTFQPAITDLPATDKLHQGIYKGAKIVSHCRKK